MQLAPDGAQLGVPGCRSASDRLCVGGIPHHQDHGRDAGLRIGIPGTVMLKGSHGFRFDGRVQNGLEPSYYCGPIYPCLPGATVPFTATWVGTDIPGTARVQGDEFTIEGLDGTSMYVELRGSFVAPAHVTDGASVTVPFTSTGLLARGYPLAPST